MDADKQVLSHAYHLRQDPRKSTYPDLNGTLDAQISKHPIHGYFTEKNIWILQPAQSLIY
jgi:hypothetical protein